MSIYSAEAPTGVFLRINKCPNSKATVRLFGDPVMFEKETNFNNVKKKAVRFATSCLYRNPETKENELRVFEFGWTIQKKLKALNDDDGWGDPTGYDVTISATGSGIDTEYQIVPRKQTDLSDGEKKLIASCDHDLLKMCKGEEPDAGGQSGDQSYDPFSDQ